jgi:hypothetical protein
VATTGTSPETGRPSPKLFDDQIPPLGAAPHQEVKLKLEETELGGVGQSHAVVPRKPINADQQVVQSRRPHPVLPRATLAVDTTQKRLHAMDSPPLPRLSHVATSHVMPPTTPINSLINTSHHSLPQPQQLATPPMNSPRRHRDVVIKIYITLLFHINMDELKLVDEIEWWIEKELHGVRCVTRRDYVVWYRGLVGWSFALYRD